MMQVKRIKVFPMTMSVVPVAVAGVLAFATPVFSQDQLPHDQSQHDQFQGETHGTLPTETQLAAPPDAAVATIPASTTPATAVVPHHHSLTGLQVRELLEAKGYTKVRALDRDKQMVWHGRAQRDGQDITFELDRDDSLHEVQ